MTLNKEKELSKTQKRFNKLSSILKENLQRRKAGKKEEDKDSGSDKSLKSK